MQAVDRGIGMPQAALRCSPTVSTLLKQRRRRCGGIFKPVEDPSRSYAVEYEWPYHQVTRAPVPQLSVDTGKANQETLQPSLNASHNLKGTNDEIVQNDQGSMGRHYRQAWEYTIRNGPLRNLATRDGLSTRSLSIYSQPSDDDLAARMRKEKSEGSDSIGLCASNDLLVPKVRARVEDDLDTGWANLSQASQQERADEVEMKGVRYGSTHSKGIRQVGAKLRARTHSLTDMVIGKLSNFQIRKAKCQKIGASEEEGRTDSAERSSPSNSQHSAKLEYGPPHSVNNRDGRELPAEEPKLDSVDSFDIDRANRQFFRASLENKVGGGDGGWSRARKWRR